MARHNKPRIPTQRVTKCQKCHKDFTYMATKTHHVCDPCKNDRAKRAAYTYKYMDHQAEIGIRTCLACTKKIKGPYVVIDFKRCVDPSVDPSPSKICEACWWFIFELMAEWLSRGKKDE